MIQLTEIIKRIPALRTSGTLEKGITKLVAATSNTFDTDTLTWVSDKNQSIIPSITAGTIICSAKCDPDSFLKGCTYIITDNPRSYFSKVIKLFFAEEEEPGIDASALVHPTSKIGLNVCVKPGVIIEADCVIGDHTIIDCNTVIKKHTVIGSYVKIGANNTIGGTGFGYEKDENGLFQQIHHIGNVVIEDYVEIGNNTAVDRAVLGSTILRKNCKVDNLVHIAHGVIIGENSLVIANALIGGSTTIGKNVWVAPSASIINKIEIGDDAFIGMGAVVIKSVAPNQTVVGNPARPLEKK